MSSLGIVCWEMFYPWLFRIGMSKVISVTQLKTPIFFCCVSLGWLRVFVSFNEELKLYCNDLVMMTFNHPNFGFLHESKSHGAGSSKQKGDEVPESCSLSEESEGSEDEPGNPLKKFKNDVCSLLQLLVNQKFAHPYGTVAGSVA